MALDTRFLKVYLRGVDLSTRLQSCGIDRTRDEVDDTTFADTSRSMFPTFQRVGVAFAGLYDDGANTIGEALRQANVTDEEPVTLHPEGSTVGNLAEMILAHRASISEPEVMNPGQVIRASMRASSRTAIAVGQVVYNGLINADTQTAPIQLTALTTGHRALATIHLIAITSTPAATFFLESDDAVGFTTPTIQATSASQTARGSLSLSAIATLAVPITDTWWRVRWDWTTPGDFSAVISLGRTTG